MARRKTKIRFFTVSDYVDEEKWLENNHKNGWKLVNFIPPCFFVFEECNSQEVIYKLDYENKKVSGDYIQMYKDYGWEYLCSGLGWNYFRKVNINSITESEKEIFSDSQSKLNMINHIYKTRMFPLFIIFLVTLIPQFSKFVKDTHRSIDIYFGGIFMVFFFVYLYIFIHCGFKLRKLKKELER